MNILKEMLQSTSKQTNVLTSENHRLKKRFEKLESRYAKKYTDKKIT